ncbi:hypothetical protein XAP7430_1120073 [Xanthomonas phaseoli pv. phaseoli]|uniref:Secreted protein n=1 Tax=Xanthomonas campestris pv. phaseoli TaxID=317013 RepID=A0AB38DV16_XANCH|nr:hypothetical protein XAP7430_1120073 [Xanthomonas phaseoli pv. phaseoli]
MNCLPACGRCASFLDRCRGIAAGCIGLRRAAARALAIAQHAIVCCHCTSKAPPFRLTVTAPAPAEVSTLIGNAIGLPADRFAMRSHRRRRQFAQLALV